MKTTLILFLALAAVAIGQTTVPKWPTLQITRSTGSCVVDTLGISIDQKILDAQLGVETCHNLAALYKAKAMIAMLSAQFDASMKAFGNDPKTAPNILANIRWLALTEIEIDAAIASDEMRKVQLAKEIGITP